jgi:hypothetical protein
MSVRLRPLRLDDEAAFVAAHRAMEADHFNFGLGYAAGMSWPRYLDALETHPGASTSLLAGCQPRS